MEQYSRTTRIGDEIKRVLGMLIEREVKDPRIGFVTVTGVKVSRDLSLAAVYVTVGDADNLDETMAGLSAAAGFLRKRVGESIRLRNTPELRFIYDKSLDRGFQMDALLKRIADERNDSP
jgi:ribosome-binding factor A